MSGCSDAGRCYCGCALCLTGAHCLGHRNGAGVMNCHLWCTRQPVTYDKAALENEKVIYRTRVTCIYIDWNAANQSGECVVTNVRLILKWDDGSSNEYPLTRIASVQAVPDIRFTSRLRKDVPGIRVHLTNRNNLIDDLRLATPTAGVLASKIRSAMT
jgi:hypothetical protein